MRLGKAVRTAVGAARQPARQRGGGFFLAAAKRGRLRVFFPVGLPDLLYLYAHARDNLIIKEKAAETAAAKERGARSAAGKADRTKRSGGKAGRRRAGRGGKPPKGNPPKKREKGGRPQTPQAEKTRDFRRRSGGFFGGKKPNDRNYQNNALIFNTTILHKSTKNEKIAKRFAKKSKKNAPKGVAGRGSVSKCANTPLFACYKLTLIGRIDQKKPKIVDFFHKNFEKKY